MEQQSKLVAALRRSLLDEVFQSLGLGKQGWPRRLVEPFFWLSAHRFARLASTFDQYVEQSGVRAAIRQILPRLVGALEVQGAENVPAEGPLLITSNHPGTYDSLVITASLPRDDLSIIASGFNFLRNLPATSRHLIFTTLDIHERMAVVRAAIRRLKEGGALLIFPSGTLDPDPQLLEGAEQALDAWSPSLEVILRRVPQTRVLVTIVSGVLSSTSYHHPFVRLWKGMRERQKAAEVVQVVQQMLFPKRFTLEPRVSFGAPLVAEELLEEESPAGVLSEIVSNARQLLENHSCEAAT